MRRAQASNLLACAPCSWSWWKRKKCRPIIVWSFGNHIFRGKNSTGTAIDPYDIGEEFIILVVVSHHRISSLSGSLKYKSRSRCTWSGTNVLVVTITMCSVYQVLCTQLPVEWRTDWSRAPKLRKDTHSWRKTSPDVKLWVDTTACDVSWWGEQNCCRQFWELVKSDIDVHKNKNWTKHL